MTIQSVTLHGGTAGTIVTDEATYIYLNGMPGNFLPLCPRCGCCTFETRGYDEGEGVCIGACHYEEAHDHPEVFGRYCPACFTEHHGPVCPYLTLTGLA